jgi:hypothetical protein
MQLVPQLARRAARLTLLPVAASVSAFTAVRALRRSAARKADAELWAEATAASAQAGTERATTGT